MNYAESFDQFSSRLGPTDVALYAGIALVAWVLFKDKLNPVSSVILSVVNKVKDLINTKKSTVADNVVLPGPVESVVIKDKDKEDIFFKLVVSWKQTRELAVLSGCHKAVEVADEMFPYLSPIVCEKSKEVL
jgi:hypothetical protein